MTENHEENEKKASDVSDDTSSSAEHSYPWQAEDGFFHGVCVYCRKPIRHILPVKYCPGGDCRMLAQAERSRQFRLQSQSPTRRCHCLECQHEWHRRVERPAYCPRCLSRNWDGKLKVVGDQRYCRCAFCDHKWRRRAVLPAVCPRCHRRDWDVHTEDGFFRATAHLLAFYKGSDERINQIRSIVQRAYIPTKEIPIDNSFSTDAHESNPETALAVPSAAPSLETTADTLRTREMDRILREALPRTLTPLDEVIDLDTLTPPTPPSSDLAKEATEATPCAPDEAHDEGLKLIRDAFRNLP